jgi:hypothetical protein
VCRVGQEGGYRSVTRCPADLRCIRAQRSEAGTSQIRGGCLLRGRWPSGSFGRQSVHHSTFHARRTANSSGSAVGTGALSRQRCFFGVHRDNRTTPPAMPDHGSRRLATEMLASTNARTETRASMTGITRGRPSWVTVPFALALSACSGELAGPSSPPVPGAGAGGSSTVPSGGMVSPAPEPVGLHPRRVVPVRRARRWIAAHRRSRRHRCDD